MDKTNINSSKVFVQSFGYLQNITTSINFINTSIHTYIHNNHRKLNNEQILDLKSINIEYKKLLNLTSKGFTNNELNDLESFNILRQSIDNKISVALNKQIERIQQENVSQKSSTLYFTILTEVEYTVDRIEKLVRLYIDIDKQIND